MDKYRSLYSTDFSAFQKLCRDHLVEKVRVEGATREAFEDDYVNLKTTCGIHKVKYSARCRFTRPRQIASRGTTWFPDGSWYFTLPKFPNGCQSSDFFGVGEQVVIADLVNQGYQIHYMPKWDGSAIHLFRHGGETHAYTLGSLNCEIKMQGSFPDSPTFFDLAIELFRKQYPDGEAWLDHNPGCGFVFEMCSRWNLIVTQYSDLGERGRLHPLVTVERDGSLSWRFPDAIARDHVSWHYSSQSTDSRDLERFEAELCQRLVDDPRFGTNPEGLVSYAVKPDGTGIIHPVFKKKRPEYLVDHRKLVLQPGCRQDFNNVCEAVIQETYDDWIHPNDEYKRIRDKYRDRIEHYLAEVAARFRSTDPSGKRIYHLQVLDGAEYHGMTNRGRFARYLNSLGIPKWLLNGLFQMHSQFATDGSASTGRRFSENSEEELVRTVLLGVSREPKSGEEGITRLASLQRLGPYWFDPQSLVETPLYTDYRPVEIPSWSGEPGLAVFDWDHTAAPCREAQTTTYYEDPDTVMPPWPHAVRAMATYCRAGWRVVVVTGRLYRVRDRILQHLAEAGLPAVEVYCCPPRGNRKSETVPFKSHTVQTLAEGMHTVVHFDDDDRVLHSLLPSPIDGVRYVPYVATLSPTGVSQFNPYVQGHKPLVVVKIGPPGDGKTAFARAVKPLIEREGREFFTTGFDTVKLRHRQQQLELPEEQRQPLSREDLFDTVMCEIRIHLRPGFVVYVDMCHDGTSVLKRLRQMHTRGQIYLLAFSTMRLVKTVARTKAGKALTESSLDAGYRQALIDRAHARIDDPGDNSSTLTRHDKVEEVIDFKAVGCVRNVTNTALGVVQLDPDLTPTQQAEEAINRLREPMHQTVATDSYLAVPIPRTDLPPTPDGHGPVALPHLTCAFGDHVDRHLPLTFSESRVRLFQTVSDGKVLGVMADIDPEYPGYGDHVTVGTAKGIAPVHTKRLVVKPTIDPVAVYQSTVVPM